jgi:hypothetical protein
MKRRLTILALTTLTMMALISVVFTAPAPARSDGATQISGIGTYIGSEECTDLGASYTYTMTGDLTGCVYASIETSRCTQGGAYFETGTETFVGLYNDQPGTFRTNYVFTAKYRDCPNFVGEIAGRCQHPIAAGSGTGVFEGVRGRYDMKDDVEVGNFPYRGHLLF